MKRSDLYSKILSINVLILFLLIFSLKCTNSSKSEPDPVGSVASDEDWELVFRDEFEGENNSWKEKWNSADNPTGHILSGRYPENIEVRNGFLQLINKKETRNDQNWTSGSVWTKKQFNYGYFEARYRYAPVRGLNQSFWLMSHGTYRGGEGKFEIDINEGHYPREINTNYHYMQEEEHKSASKTYHVKNDLSEDFHVYGLKWHENELIYYFDGKVIRRVQNTFAHKVTPVRLSSAVIEWAGPVTDAIDGTSMDIDYVRVWRASAK